MAQTKKRRTTKHRGNAAGMVETRGRTGRKPRPDERKAAPQSAKDRRLERMARPPSWRSAFIKAAIAALVLLVLSVTVLGQTLAQAATLVPFLFAVYVPLGYYTDRWIHQRHLRRQARA